jgi:REP element-mobilizing transposase RayT
MRRIETLGWHSRGYLPHFDGGQTAQMVTFRLADSLPKERLEAWKDELERLPECEAAAEYYRRVEEYLDRGSGKAWLRDRRVALMLRDALLHFEGERYRLYAWVIMPNHVHVLIRTLDGHDLAGIVQSWKSFTAKQANKILGLTGHFWQKEYFDRYVRDERHFAAAVSYIERNPVKAGLCPNRETWEFGSAATRMKESRER